MQYTQTFQQVEESLKSCPDVSDNVEVVMKENMKERYHYKDHRLIHEIIVLPKPGRLRL